MENRCHKCNGLLWGDILHSADFYCKGHPEPTYSLMGWECPRCRTIHSPYTTSCGCAPPTITTTELTIPQWVIDHNANQ